MADVAADVDGVVTTDGAGGRGGGVGGTEKDTAGLDGVTALPDHGADGTGGHVWVRVSMQCHVGGQEGRDCRYSAGVLEGLVGEIEKSKRTGNQSGEEGLAVEVLVVLLEVLLAGLAKLDGSKLEAAALEALDDGTNEATLKRESVCCLLPIFFIPLQLRCMPQLH